MAAAYREEILSLQAVGPYYLCGNCFGGTVAFEIAQQLRQQGQEVALLALINTAFPGNFLDYLISRLRSPYGLRSLTRLPVKSWGPHLGRRFLNLARRATRQRAPQGKHIHVDSRQSDPHGLNVNERNIRAEAGYSPPEYDGELILICAGPPHNQRGWIGVASGGCRVIEVPVKGDPPTMPQLTLDPYVSPLAAHISELMER
jgi:pimeloyl-ACP methyl ester carboxylesterase